MNVRGPVKANAPPVWIGSIAGVVCLAFANPPDLTFAIWFQSSVHNVAGTRAVVWIHAGVTSENLAKARRDHPMPWGNDDGPGAGAATSGQIWVLLRCRAAPLAAPTGHGPGRGYHRGRRCLTSAAATLVAGQLFALVGGEVEWFVRASQHSPGRALSN